MNMIKNYSFLFLFAILIFSQSGNAQNQNWAFGEGAGVSFCNGAPVNFSSPTLTTGAGGTATVSDAACRLLFYTDGISVWDSTGTVMPHGQALAGTNGTDQSSMIVQDPGNPARYYIFVNNASYADPNGVYNGFSYSIVDMSLPGNGTAGSPHGDVVSGSVNSILYKSAGNMSFYSSPRLAAVNVCGTNDYWIVTHESSPTSTDTFIFYRLTASGVTYDHKQGIGSAMFGNCLGSLHISQDGTKAVSTLWANPSSATGGADVFSFNNQTGLFSNWIKLDIPTGSSINTWGAEFSPNGNLVYLSNLGATSNQVSAIFQYNLNAGSAAAINSTVVTLDSVNVDTIPGYNGTPSPVVYFYGELSLGADGKIYSAEEDQNFLAVIDHPDLVGSACGLRRNGYQLGSGMRCKIGMSNQTVTSGCPSGIQELNVSAISIFPNPNNGSFTLQTAESINSDYIITDMLGNVVSQEPIKSDSQLIALLNASEGVYLLSVKGAQPIKFVVVR